ncbi:hypothetical protein GQ43DRAFT_36256 [Delitschia confertaspora ATCC 74209]|uniref:Uncharacterized protein n=1 Tax=Delitschia confertaspora ATCC 74209 TaxID=1513339 RepID=A0A9P4MWP0_9PLEO|nr:hypothetical protein GQ43DRAFT_36256 [Delitschia confertaspora ATCC 74209]
MTRIYVNQRTITYNSSLHRDISSTSPVSLSPRLLPPLRPGGSPPESRTVKVCAPGAEEGGGVGLFFATTIRSWDVGSKCAGELEVDSIEYGAYAAAVGGGISG